MTVLEETEGIIEDEFFFMLCTPIILFFPLN